MNAVEYNMMARSLFRLLKEWTEFMVRVAEQLDRSTYASRMGSELRIGECGHAVRHHFVEPLDLSLFYNELKSRGSLPVIFMVLETLYKITKDVSRECVRDFLTEGSKPESFGMSLWEIIDSCTFSGAPEELPQWYDKLRNLDHAVEACLETFPIRFEIPEHERVNSLFTYVAHQAKNLLIVILC